MLLRELKEKEIIMKQMELYINDVDGYEIKVIITKEEAVAIIKSLIDSLV